MSEELSGLNPYTIMKDNNVPYLNPAIQSLFTKEFEDLPQGTREVAAVFLKHGMVITSVRSDYHGNLRPRSGRNAGINHNDGTAVDLSFPDLRGRTGLWAKVRFIAYIAHCLKQSFTRLPAAVVVENDHIHVHVSPRWKNGVYSFRSDSSVDPRSKLFKCCGAGKVIPCFDSEFNSQNAFFD